MGFFKSEKGSIISELFKLAEEHGPMKPDWMYEIALYGDYLKITQKVGGKAEASLKYSQINDVFYGTMSEVKQVKQSPIGRALVGGFLFGGAGAIVGAMTADTKEKTKIANYLIISYTSSSGEDRYLQFEDSRMYKGKKLAKQLQELCNITPALQRENNSIEL